MKSGSEMEGVELYWTWIGKIMAVVCQSVKLVSRGICYKVTNNNYLEGKSYFRCCSEVVMGVLIWL